MNRRQAAREQEKRVNIIIPICMQNDFIGPKGIQSDREIQSLVLHGGARASQKILGDASGLTPIDDLMEVIHGDDYTYVIYIQDEHPDDPNDQAIQTHFQIFGKHCIAGTEGVKPVGRLQEFQRLRRSQVITTDALNIVTHQPVVDAVTAILTENEIDNALQVKFVVLGGLTDVLVADCARGFNHICGIPNPYRADSQRWMFFTNVAVPERYTFSNNNTEHLSALRSMDKVAIKIPRTDAEIFSFLRIEV